MCPCLGFIFRSLGFVIRFKQAGDFIINRIKRSPDNTTISQLQIKCAGLFVETFFFFFKLLNLFIQANLSKQVAALLSFIPLLFSLRKLIAVGLVLAQERLLRSIVFIYTTNTCAK